MLTCRQVSRALHERDYHTLPLRSRVGLRIHVALCIFCGCANRQLMAFQDGVRAFLRHEDQGPVASSVLAPAARERIKAALRAP